VGKSPRRGVAAAVVGACLLVPGAAHADQITVDDDGVQCPSAAYSRIALAIAAAAPGDTISICDGVYLEGAGGPGTSALTIRKPLTLKGAGPGRTYIGPVGGGANQIASNVAAGQSANLRDGLGDIIAVIGTEAHISGVTVYGNRVAVDAGVSFTDASGSLVSSEIVDIVQPEGTALGNGRYGVTDGGVGVAAAHGPAATDPAHLETVTIRDSLIEGYNKAGIVLDSRQPDGTPQTGTTRGVWGVITGNRITGAGQQRAIAQDGIRVLNGNGAVILENTITDNLYPADRTMSAGVRFDQSRNTSQTRINLNTIQGNGAGLVNTQVTGTNPFQIDAVQNWWGSQLGPATDATPDRGDWVNGTLSTTQANRTNSVNFSDLLVRPAAVTQPFSQFVDEQPTVALSRAGSTFTADARDDIGVRRVVFRAGTQVIGVDELAPYTATWTPTAGLHAVTATVEDSRGQTGVAAVAVSGGGSDDAPPSLNLTAPTTATVGPGAFTASATATDDVGVASVKFTLGTREVCTVTAAPYTCAITPLPAELGQTLSLIVVATDTTGQTDAIIKTLKIAPAAEQAALPASAPAPLATIAQTPAKAALSAMAKASRGALKTSGKLTGAACSGKVTLTYKRAGKVVATRKARLTKSCTYTVTAKLRRGTYTVRASLGAVAAKTVKAKVR
jgi:Bacterial Ig domain